ncbi:MAG: hypothetical protein HYW05_01070 [Candidatus Diapherotrites archaeon]|nr:hypothetical protein [Candidatus Diapherotrites archaeon]
MTDWIKKALEKYSRNTVFVHFHPHADIKVPTRNVDVDKIVSTARRGRIYERKSTYPNRIAFSNFFKEGYTYVVIVELFPDSFQVKTVWKIKGRI